LALRSPSGPHTSYITTSNEAANYSKMFRGESGVAQSGGKPVPICVHGY